MSASAGYSGKPLWAKLGLMAGQRVEVIDCPVDYATLTGFDTATLVFPARGELDVIHGFTHTRTGLDALLTRAEKRLVERGMLWVSWPKRTSKIASAIACEITEDTIRELALPRGWVDIKVCAVDADWSGLKLVRRKS
ncbi:DUF3052 domain-containing protein [Lysobacter fragariae]